jgi:hypothetical protein
LKVIELKRYKQIQIHLVKKTILPTITSFVVFFRIIKTSKHYYNPSCVFLMFLLVINNYFLIYKYEKKHEKI